MDKAEQLKRLEFQERFGLSPEKCKELMERVAEIVNQEVSTVIEHADFYMNPLDYCDEGHLKEIFGDDCLEKSDEDDDGYTKLYDFKKSHSAAETFQHFISYRTRYGGYTSATKACRLMDIGEGWSK